MINTTEKTVCKLISNIVFGNPIVFQNDIDWNAVYQELTSHAILGMFREALPSFNLPQSIREDWQTQIWGIIAKGVQISAGQRELIQLLDEKRIPYAILKGTAAAQYYPLKNSRTLGDVDFIVKETDYEYTQQIMENAGYQRIYEFENNLRHVSYIRHGIHYECHHLYARNSFMYAERINELITSNISNAVMEENEYGMFMSLPTEINGLVLLVHIAIHIGSGLGLRQILDWLLYARLNLSDDEWLGERGKIIRETGLDRLAKVVTKAGQLYFGLNTEITWCSDAPEQVCEELIELVFSYGNFGNKNTIEDKVVGVARQYRRDIIKNLKASGEHNWKLLRKYPWLKPLAPLYQIGRYIIQVFTKKGALKALLGTKKEVDARERLMIQLGI